MLRCHHLCAELSASGYHTCVFSYHDDAITPAGAALANEKVATFPASGFVFKDSVQIVAGVREYSALCKTSC